MGPEKFFLPGARTRALFVIYEKRLYTEFQIYKNMY